MRYVVKPAGTFNVKAERFDTMQEADACAILLIKDSGYAMAMIGVEWDYNGEAVYEPQGYWMRENNTLTYTAQDKNNGWKKLYHQSGVRGYASLPS